MIISTLDCPVAGWVSLLIGVPQVSLLGHGSLMAPAIAETLVRS